MDETVLGGPHPEGYPLHHLICGAGGIITENLTGVDAVDFDDPIISLLPIKLARSDGSPVRAVTLQSA